MAKSRQTPPAPAAGVPAMTGVDDADPPKRASPNLDEEQELFHINGDGLNYENFAMYRKYGYHPIILGDVLPEPGTCENDQSKAPRYRVIQKLGFGAFATVWLARDLQECRYVALKVCCGVDKPTFSRETNILHALQQSDRAHAGFDNILTLYEAFIISGPNGFHECLVTEVVAPLFGIGIKGGWSKKDILRQIAAAVLLLHSKGLAHGDLHSENFGVAVPGLQEVSEEDIMDLLGEQEVLPVIPRDPLFPRDTIPAYVTPSALLGALLTGKGQYPKPISAIIKLLDFGRAFSVDRPPRYLPGGAPFEIRPPEVILYDITDGKAGTVWSKEADIWALGCAIYSAPLIDQHGFRDFYQRLGNALRTGGPPPEEWLGHLDFEKLASFTSRYSPGDDRPIVSKDQLMSGLSEAAATGWRDREQRYRADDQHDYIDLIRRMVVTEPGARLDIAGVLAHPWLRWEA